MKYLFSVFWLTILFSILSAQTPSKNFSVRWRLGYNTFSMNDLKAYNTEILDFYHNRKIDLQPTDNFPSYLGILGEFYFNNINPPFGFFVEHTSTGSRLTYHDYSGRSIVDLLVRRYSAGLFTEKQLWHKNTLSFLASLHVSVLKNKVILKESLIVGDYSNIDHLEFVGYGVAIEPNVVFRKRMGWLLVGLNFGYQFDVPIFDLKETTTHQELSLHNKNVNPQWKGFRSGFSLGINF